MHQHTKKAARQTSVLISSSSCSPQNVRKLHLNGLNVFPSLSLAVVPFMHVFEKSRCQSREVLVDIYQEYPDHIEHQYIPSCVVVKRCSGFCNDEAMECVPTRTRNVTMTVSTRASLTPLTSPPSLRLFVPSSCLSLLLSSFLSSFLSFFHYLSWGRRSGCR